MNILDEDHEVMFVNFYFNGRSEKPVEYDRNIFIDRYKSYAILCDNLFDYLEEEYVEGTEHLNINFVSKMNDNQYRIFIGFLNKEQFVNCIISFIS